MIKVYYTILPEEPDLEFIARCTPLLPEKLQKGVKSYLFEKDQMRGLVAKLLVHHAIDPSKPAIEILADWNVNEYGCPYLPEQAFFNLTHSGNLVALAISESEVGIDVEKIREVDFELLHNYMNAEEWTDILRHEDSQYRFFEYWTIKEALMKGERMGFYLPLEEIKLAGLEAEIRGKKWFLKKLELDKKHLCHIASIHKDPTISLFELPINKF